ncbi:MAG TPA: lipoyl(octanoyl) transferase LipB [Solirubrobacteraceae bacterium]|nr:lipoyl(octanoyl) transferase LipB [Solirubrobacteraceae bacterium]
MRTNTASRSSGELLVCPLGMTPYRDALAIQAGVQTRCLADELPDTLLLLEHPPVYTRGRRSLDGELSLGEDFYRSRGIEIVPTDRGGRVTYHGPGQLVGYPIMRVTDIGAHLRTMEAAIVAVLAECGIEARSRCEEGIDYTGVWVEDRKIASIGVHISRGVSTHGFAVNVTNDLTPFTWIVPCGLAGVTMTSVAQELGHEPAGGLDAFAKRVARCFCDTHGRRLLAVSPESVGIAWSKTPARPRDRTSRATDPRSSAGPRGCDPNEHPPNTAPPAAERERVIAYPLGHR